MAQTWSTSKKCWVDDKTGQPPKPQNHNVYSTDKKKWVSIPVGSKLPAPSKPKPN